MADPMLGVARVSELADVSQQAVVAACDSGSLKAEKVSGVWVIRRSAALAWINKRARVAEEAAAKARAAATNAAQAEE
jgi:hypothetical protein